VRPNNICGFDQGEWGVVCDLAFGLQDAKDVTHGFFFQQPVHKALARADGQKGKFPSLASPKNFLSKLRRRGI
jgi:hypothetical protein